MGQDLPKHLVELLLPDLIRENFEDDCCHLGNRRHFKQRAQGYLNMQRIEYTRNQDRGQKRIATQFQKMIVNAYLLQTQYLSPDFDQCFL